MEIAEKILHLNDCEVLIENDNNTGQPAVLIKTNDKVLMLTSHHSGFIITDETGFWDIIDKKISIYKKIINHNFNLIILI